MATTGFWPVKSRLKEVIDYAENPDKTIDKKYVDSDLYAALQYAADDKKTDERNAMRQKEHKRLEQAVEQGTKRIAEIDRLIEKVFEQNAIGVLSDERFSKMLQSYEKEQKALTQEVAESRQTLEEAKQKATDLRLLLRTLREMTEINELTPTLVNSLIERIEVHNNDKSSGHCYVKVDICFTAVGMIDIPTEQEILAMMEEIRANPQDFRFVA